MKAFPHTYEKTQEEGRVATVTQFGMDLRDWFAGLAMQSIISNEGSLPEFRNTDAEIAYKMADAMMKAREQ